MKKHINKSHILLVMSALSKINEELERCYWNKNQKEIDSPFLNTGNTYSNDTFSVRAYSWCEENDKPNFKYKDMECYWYKHFGRGLTVSMTDGELTLDFLTDMINDCIKSIRKDFDD